MPRLPLPSDPGERAVALGDAVRRARLQHNFDQVQLAERAGVSVRALRNLEAGRGSQVATFLRVLDALGLGALIDQIAPTPSVSPMALLRATREPRRAGRPRKHRE